MSFNEFKLELILFKSEINEDDFTHFPILNEHFNSSIFALLRINSTVKPVSLNILIF